jgi:hypothetical protein
MQIHVSHDGKRSGPLSVEEVKARLLSGEFKPSDLAWSEGGKVDWKPLSSFPEIAEPARQRLLRRFRQISSHLPTARPPSAQETSGLAIASVICGVLSITILPCFSAIPAVICGHLAKSKINARPDLYRGEGLALAGLITGYIGLALIALLPSSRDRSARIYRGSTAGQTNEIIDDRETDLLACKSYAEDHDGAFPERSTNSCRNTCQTGRRSFARFPVLRSQSATIISAARWTIRLRSFCSSVNRRSPRAAHRRPC